MSGRQLPEGVDTGLTAQQESTACPGPTLVLVHALSRVERAIVLASAQARLSIGGSAIEIVDVSDPELLSRLSVDGDLRLLPMSVTWNTGTPNGMSLSRRVGRNVRPPEFAQAALLRQSPRRCQAVVGDGATVAELRSRWETTGAIETGEAGFAAFVKRQAIVALDRADRRRRGDAFKVPRMVAEAIVDSAQFRFEVEALSKKLRQSPAETFSSATEALRGMVAVSNSLSNAYMSVLKPMHQRAWKVEGDSAALEELRELNKAHALVFLPTHRSYVDSMVLGAVLADHGFPRNHTLGGNNVAFWPLGALGRRAGVIWIRRSFSDDEPYKLAVRAYLSFLLEKRFNLEWYIEGGRSRSGKLRAPRYGLMSYLVQALQSGSADDAILVPVSITYDNLPELAEMVAEESGHTKRAEGLNWLARYISGNWRRAGNAAVRFGKPMPLRLGMNGYDVNTDEGRSALRLTTLELCTRINDATPVQPASLVTLALLGTGGKALYSKEILAVLDPLLSYTAQRDHPTFGLGRLRSPAGLDLVLHDLERAGVVSTFRGGNQPLFLIKPGQHHLAAFYRNSAIHWYLDRAITELAMLAAARASADDARPRAWTEATAIRDLLKFEFFLPDRETFGRNLRTEMDLIDLDWEAAASPAAITRLLARSRPLMAHRVLRPFLEGYSITARVLAQHRPEEPVDERQLLAECRTVGSELLLRRELVSPEAVTSEIVANAIKLARHRGLVDAADPNVAEQRAQFATATARLVTLTNEIASIDGAGNG